MGLKPRSVDTRVRLFGLPRATSLRQQHHSDGHHRLVVLVDDCVIEGQDALLGLSRGFGGDDLHPHVHGVAGPHRLERTDRSDLAHRDDRFAVELGERNQTDCHAEREGSVGDSGAELGCAGVLLVGVQWVVVAGQAGEQRDVGHVHGATAGDAHRADREVLEVAFDVEGTRLGGADDVAVLVTGRPPSPDRSRPGLRARARDSGRPP